MKKIVITGGLGYIGSELCKKFTQVTVGYMTLKLLIIDLYQDE